MNLSEIESKIEEMEKEMKDGMSHNRMKYWVDQIQKMSGKIDHIQYRLNSAQSAIVNSVNYNLFGE